MVGSLRTMALRLALLDHPDHGVDHDHRQNHQGVHQVSEYGGDQCRAKQHIDQEVVELQ